MARVRRARSGKTKQAIIEACIAELNERGYFDASIDAIAARAGLSKMTVYYHYESKEALCVEAITEILQRLKKDLIEELSDFESTVAALEHAIGVLWNHFNTVGRSFYTLLGELRWINPQLLSQIEKEISAYSKIVREIVVAGQQRGEIIDENTTVLTQLFIGSIASTIQWYDPKGSTPPAEFLSLLKTRLPNLLLSSPAGEPSPATKTRRTPAKAQAKGETEPVSETRPTAKC